MTCDVARSRRVPRLRRVPEQGRKVARRERRRKRQQDQDDNRAGENLGEHVSLRQYRLQKKRRLND